jgi:hypothetical protein
MFKKTVLVGSMVFVLLFVMLASLNAGAFAFPNEFRPEGIPLPKAPFDLSETVDVSKEFLAKHELVRINQLDLPHGDPFEQTILQTSDHWWGAGIREGYGVLAVYARHYIDEALELPNDEPRILYAPTLRAPDPCPLEAGFAYHSSGSKYFYVYDLYYHNFTLDLTVAELKNEHYLSSEQYYEVGIAWDGNGWGVYLRDFSTGQMEGPIRYSSNSVNKGDGWDYYEAYYDGTWPNTAYLKASEIMVYLFDPYYGYYWDYNWGWSIFGTGYEINNWSGGGFNVPHSWINNYYEWWAGVGHFYVSSIVQTGTDNGGQLEHPEYIVGESPDGNYAHLICPSSGSTAKIIALMNAEATGKIKVYCYSQPGYVSDLYVYVSMDNYYWQQVGSKIGVGQTSPSWLDIGTYSGDFIYIAICGYDTTRPVNLYVDAVRADT